MPQSQKEEKTNKNELKETKDKESTTEQQTTTSSQTMGQKCIKSCRIIFGFYGIYIFAN